MSGIEGLAAVSLAGNILQFVISIKHLVSTTREVLDSGAKLAHRELEAVAKDWSNRVESLKIPSDRPDESLEVLAFQCKETADKLLAVLAKLKLEENGDRWKSVLQALRSQWHESEIEALRQRLNTIGQAVSARLADEDRLGLQNRLDKLLEVNLQLEAPRRDELVELKQLALELQKLSQQKSVDEEKLAMQVKKVASAGIRYSAEQRILQDLRFERIEDRYSSITEAHRQTPNWLFDDDLYWITGRPGSGKSTLMKFLFTQDATKEHLARWAGDDEVIIAEYFFWNTGKNELQKSQQGLLRSLIYQILRKCPEYICKVFPGTWGIYNVTEGASPGSDDTLLPHDIPPDTETATGDWTKALQRTCDILTQSKKRFCFFIDGLDEYSGNIDQLINLVAILRALNQVKICVSSRPWTKFEAAYGKNQMTKLLMEDFNGEDIIAYIEDVFANDENYQELADVETEGKSLVDSIVASANGVFLWVVLVVRSLQDGLIDGDGIGRLQDRLRDFRVTWKSCLSASCSRTWRKRIANELRGCFSSR